MISECKYCEARVEAPTEGSYTHYDEEIGVEFTYSLLRCPRCSNPILVQQADQGDGSGRGEVDRMYPPDESRLSAKIPRGIRSAYGEAVGCLRSRSYTAAAIMCRKTLEGICAAHGIKEPALVKSLRAMKDAGIIENRLFEWADALRIVGNEAAHDINVIVSSQDARDLLDFSNALLEYTFTFRDKFEEFKKRRQKASTA